MANTTSKQFRAEGKNSDVEAPPWVFTGTVGDNTTDTITLLNVAQYLKVHNFGPGTLRVGFNNVAAKGINGDCYFKLAAGQPLELPCEFAKLFLHAENTTGDCEVSIAITLSSKGVGSMKGANGLAADDNFDGVEEIPAARNTI